LVSTMSAEKEMVRFVFRLDKCDHRPSICLEALSLEEICSRFEIVVSPDRSPLSASELFTESFESEVFPFIGKLLRNRFTKTKFAKLWDAQPVTVQKIYERRADILLKEWKRLRAQCDDAAVGGNTEADVEAARLLSESKAKRKDEAQRRADLIAEQIANGMFDEPDRDVADDEKEKAKAIEAAEREKAERAEKAKDRKERAEKKAKKVKKKKVKKWKNKKQRKAEELWPAPPTTTATAATKSNATTTTPAKSAKSESMSVSDTATSSMASMASTVKKSKSTWPIQSALKATLNGLKPKTPEKLVDSELRFRLQIAREGDDEADERGSGSKSEWLEEWMDGAEMEAVRRKVSSAEFESAVRRIRLWLYLDVDLKGLFAAQSIALITDCDRVAMHSHGADGDAAVRLFELRWAALSEGIRRRVDAAKIQAAFVKNTRSLRLDIPLLSVSRCDI